MKIFFGIPPAAVDAEAVVTVEMDLLDDMVREWFAVVLELVMDLRNVGREATKDKNRGARLDSEEPIFSRGFVALLCFPC
jgi:hypothetical protein